MADPAKTSQSDNTAAVTSVHQTVALCEIIKLLLTYILLFVRQVFLFLFTLRHTQIYSQQNQHFTVSDCDKTDVYRCAAVQNT